MAFDEINASGGVMGYKIEAVVVRSGFQLAALRGEGAGLLTQDKVAAVFGCWTSVSQVRAGVRG